MQITKKIIVFILTIEARLIIRKYKPFIIAVTGSVGKTATKDAIFCALSSVGHVRKSEKSLNSEIGLPLTIIGVPNAWKSFSGWMRNIGTGLSLITSSVKRGIYPEILVLEIGADHPGDIKNVAKWLRPDIAVITKVGDKPVHVEFFDSPAQVFEEKAYLVQAVKPGGTAVLFSDEPKIVALTQELKGKGINVTTFGLNEYAQNVKGSDYAVVYDTVNGQRVPVGFTFKIGGNTIRVDKVIGKTFMYPILSAVAVAQAKGLSMEQIVNNVSSYVAPNGRMNIIQGTNGSTVIDDTYNSSPDAVISAIDTLKSTECTGRKVIVLGDMMELGSYSAQEHKNIGKLIGENAVGLTKIDKLITVGPRALAIANEAVISGMSVDNVSSYSNSIEAGSALAKFVNTGDLILIKGSQSVRMERITKAIMADPSQAEKLLVRQEKEWLEKK